MSELAQHREQALTSLQSLMRRCRLCLESGHPVVPGAVFSGPVTANVIVVGQAPGVTESDTGRPFNGASGRRLFRWLAQAGWEEDEFRSTQYLTAVTKCFPGKASGGKGDRVPTRSEQKLCAPFLARELELVQPSVIVPVGSLAVRRFLGPVKLAKVVGTVVAGDDGCQIVPLPHPSGASLWLNKPSNVAQVDHALSRLRQLRDMFDC